jgi:methionine aminopeptidase, type I
MSELRLISIKSMREIDLMRKAGEITAAARALAGEMVAPGVSTWEIDKAVFDYIKGRGAIPSFKGYNAFPGSACISVNDEVIHGIPNKRRLLQAGDIVSVDVGAIWQGYHGDCAGTFACGAISAEAQRLIDVTRQSFFEGIAFAKVGHRVLDIGAAVQRYVEEQGFSVVRDYVGHGVGAKLHEAPDVPNYADKRRSYQNPRLQAGMTLAVEPMVNAGTWKIKVLSDGSTVKTADGSLSAHYENSILITEGEAEILTPCEGI